MNDKMGDKVEFHYSLLRNTRRRKKEQLYERKNLADDVKIKYVKIFYCVNRRNFNRCFHLYIICVSDQKDYCG